MVAANASEKTVSSNWMCQGANKAKNAVAITDVAMIALTALPTQPAVTSGTKK